MLLVEDFATGERETVAADLPGVRVGQHIVVQGQRWVVIEVDYRPAKQGR
jgi:hypothetical protein